MSDPLTKLAFLIGDWKGRAENQFGEKGIVETTFRHAYGPSDKFLFGRTESRKEDGQFVNSSVSYLLFDANIGKYVRKSIFSYGWINNEVGEWKDDRLVLDVVSIDGEPEYFKGIRWRSYVRRYSEDEIGSGLEVAKQGENFRPYGETRAQRVR